MNIALDQIRIDGGTQPRATISEDAVKEYADLQFNGTTLPPIDVFFDGVAYWLADGFHRYHAARRIALDELQATVHQGTKRDAVLFSVGANQAHGLRRTNEDKRKSVTTLLADDEWANWSDREIARRCGVSSELVGDARRGYRTRSASRGESSLSESDSEKRTYTTKHGTEATMNVEKIGRGTTTASREADRVARASAGIEGASEAVLKRLPRRHDAVIVNATMQTMEGILSALEKVDPALLSSDPRAEQWRQTAARVIAVFRAFNRQLERKSA